MKTLLLNGKIFSEKGTFHEAIYIEEGTIQQVGTTQELASLSADHTIDLHGKTVIPGLNDSHLHLALTGEAMNACNLTEARSVADVIAIGRKFLLDHPETQALFGRGWNQDYFTTGPQRMLQREDLDEISTAIPIVFERVCSHIVVGNSRAITTVGVTAETTVPGGVIERDAAHQPTGLFSENAAKLLRTAIPEKTDAAIEADILRAAQYALSRGLTSVQSCDVSDKDFQRKFRILETIYGANKTPLRYSHQFNFHDTTNFKAYLETERQSTAYDETTYSTGALKLFSDGSLGGRTALLQTAYADQPDTTGVQVLPKEQLDELVQLAADNGIPVVTHAIGDGALELMLDTYEKHLVNGQNPLRHGIIHVQISRPEQLQRMAELTISAIVQPIFIDYDQSIVETRVGKTVAESSYAFRTLQQLGAPMALSTDSPIEDLNPWANLHCAITRTGLGEKQSAVFHPTERMTVEEAVSAYTSEAAYVEHKETWKGKLLPGYVADFLILDRDIFTIPPEEIQHTQVQETWINGVCVYRG